MPRRPVLAVVGSAARVEAKRTLGSAIGVASQRMPACVFAAVCVAAIQIE